MHARGRWRGRWIGFAATLASVLVACGRSPGKQLGQELDRIASAARTTQLTAKQWGEGSLPAVYTAQMARTAGRALRRSATRPIWQQTPAAIRDPALRCAAAAADVADRLGVAVRSGDRTAAPELAAHAAHLARATLRLRELASAE